MKSRRTAITGVGLPTESIESAAQAICCGQMAADFKFTGDNSVRSDLHVTIFY